MSLIPVKDIKDAGGYVIDSNDIPPPSGIWTPEMFKAAGNGIQDDSIPVQNALNAINSAGGGILLLNQDYLISNITVYSNTSVVGTSRNAGFLLKKNANWGLRTSDNSQNIYFGNFYINGQVDVYAFSEFVHNIIIGAADTVSIDSCLIKGFRGDGIYLSGQDSVGVEAHNKNIYIKYNTFDGVNKDNRNAISALDYTTLRIQNNQFKNCTRANMPGAIDIEPDVAQTYAKLLDGIIENNTFEEIGGNVAIISLFLTLSQAAMTTPMKGLIIRGNTFYKTTNAPKSPNAIVCIQAGAASETTYPNDIVIEDNHGIEIAGNAYNFAGVSRVRIDRDRWEECSGLALVGAVGRACYDVKFESGVVFRHCDLSGFGGMQVSDISYLKCYATFDGCGLSSGLFGAAIDFNTGTSDNVDLRGLIVVPGGRTTSGILKEVGHTFTPITNRKLNYTLNGLSSAFVAYAPNEELIAQVTVDVPNLASGSSYTSANVPCIGAAAYDSCRVSGSNSVQGCSLTAYVSAPDTVNFVVQNLTGAPVDLPNMDFTIWVIKA